MNNAIILAHKDQEAMKSSTVVYLHDLLDKPMIEYALAAVNGFKTTIFVNNKEKEGFAKYESQACVIGVDSDEELHHDICCENELSEYVVVFNGNTPTVNDVMIKKLVVHYKKSGQKIMSLTINHNVTGVYCISKSILTEKYSNLPELVAKNKNNSLNITISGYFAIVTNRLELSLVESELRQYVMRNHLMNGVSIKNMDSVTIGPDVEIDEDTTIYPNTYITGKVKIGKKCKLGPFIRIRQAANLADGVKIGNFVELKNATMGEKSASAHLSYLGDTTIGNKVNVGCGVITVNYDGANKFHTIIEDEAFIGCNSNLIAPVTIGRDALVAAGSTVTKDVPAESLCFGRARQVNKEGYKRPKKA